MSPGMHFNSLNCPIFPCSFCFDDSGALHIFALQARGCALCVCVLYLAASGYCVAGHIRDTEGGGGAGVTGEKPWWSALVTAEEASRTCSDEISGEKYHQTN